MVRSPGRRARALGLALLGALAGACADDRVVVLRCGDDVVDPDQLCLGPPRSTPIEGLEPHAIRVHDFDGDGDDDVLVIGLDGAVTARHLRGDGVGGLAPAIDPGVTGCSAHPSTADIDGDGRFDLVFPTCDLQLHLYFGDASGRFTGPTPVDIPALPRIAAFADPDHDGLQDLLVLDAEGRLHVRHALAPAVLGDPVTTILPAPAPAGFALVWADDDDVGDLLLVDPDPGPLRLARGRLGGPFRAPEVIAPVARGLLVADDIDGDLLADLAVLTAPRTFVVLGGDGSGAFVERQRVDLPFDPGPAVSADVDGDGDLDILIAAAQEPRVAVFHGKEGALVRAPTIDLPAPAPQIALADLRRDGALDLVAADFAGRSLTLLLADP